MPELPEVETQRRSLEHALVSKSITKIQTTDAKLFIGGIEKFRKNLVNQKIQAIDRRGKFLIFRLSNEQIFVSHFRMTGHFLLNKKGEFDTQKCIRAKFALNNGWELLYQDIRKFGRFWIGTEKTVFAQSGIENLGAEPFAQKLTLAQFLEKISHYKGSIKPLLLNQKFLAGIGNIYADESLFLAKIHPQTRTEKLTETEKTALYHAILKTIGQGIKNRGTTIGEYVDAENRQGTNQNHLYAYQRKNEPCRICGTKMKRIVVAQRGTTFCPNCQKLKK